MSLNASAPLFLMLVASVNVCLEIVFFVTSQGAVRAPFCSRESVVAGSRKKDATTALVKDEDEGGKKGRALKRTKN